MEESNHKLLKEGLNEEQQLFLEVFRSNPAALAIIRVSDEIIIEISNSFERMLGYKREEVAGKKVGEFNIKELVRNTSAQGRLPNMELTLQSKTGQLVNTIASAESFNIRNKQYLIVSFIDVSHNSRIEWELTNSESKFRVLIENLHSAVALIDENGKFIIVNNSFLQMFDIARDSDIMNVNSLDWSKWQVFHEDGSLLDIDEHPVRKVMKTGKGFRDSLVAVKTPFRKEIKWMLISAEPILERGEIHHLICTYYDITALKRSEEDLRKSREKLNIALENGNIGVWEWDIVRNVVDWDERMEKMFGLRPGSFGRTFSDFEYLLHEEDVDHVRKSINTTLENDIPLETIFRLKPRRGKTKYISSKALLGRDAKGNPVSLAGVCFDVTGLKEGTELIISKLNEDLLRSNKELESFAYVASHDLQEPLRMVSSFTQLLQKRYENKIDQTANEYIGFAVDGAKRMHELINGLLQYSRINTRGGDFSKVDMNIVLEKVKSTLAVSLKEKGITLVVENTLPKIIADEFQMNQLLQNLIGNAVKFSKPGGKISISSVSEKRSNIFSIKDEGIGIESQYFDRIFEIFQRLNPKDQYTGTGIGLAICKRIITRHGGRIWVNSVPGNGSIFYFSIRGK